MSPQLLLDVTIPRQEWTRGPYIDTCLLSSEDNRRCCLGHILRQAGTPDSALRDRGCPVDAYEAMSQQKKSIPATTRWLLSDAEYPHESYWHNKHTYKTDSKDATRLMSCNDRRDIDDASREMIIRNICRKHGVIVRFTGPRLPKNKNGKEIRYEDQE